MASAQIKLVLAFVVAIKKITLINYVSVAFVVYRILKIRRNFLKNYLKKLIACPKCFLAIQYDPVITFVAQPVIQQENKVLSTDLVSLHLAKTWMFNHITSSIIRLTHMFEPDVKILIAQTYTKYWGDFWQIGQHLRC